MKTVKISALALAITGVFAISANAQSAKANAWEGAYGQVSVGYGMVTPSIGAGTASIPANVAYSGSPAFTANTNAQNVNNINTGLANIAAGYNFGVNQDYVIGLGVSYYPGASSGATGQLVATAPSGVPGIPAGTKLDTQNATYNMKNLYSITINPGYVIDKDRLAYLKVGYTGATVGLSSQGITYNTVNLTGYTLGLGYKQMVTNSIYLLGEINYASYGQKTASSSVSGIVPVSVPVKATGTDFLVGVGYRF